MTKHYVVIGGSSGIGLAITNKLTSKGYQVYNFSRYEGKWTHPNLVNHTSFDVLTDKLPVKELPENIHGLVYCPGSILLKPFTSIQVKDFEDDLQLNFVGAVKVIQSLITPLKKGDTGSVVLFSTVAVQQGMSYHSSISAAKGAVEGLTRSLAAEYAPMIRFNCVAPSLTDTPLASYLLSDDKKHEANAKRHPMGRVGTPSDIAEMAAFLLSDRSQWMTGQVLGMDGGMSTIRKI